MDNDSGMTPFASAHNGDSPMEPDILDPISLRPTVMQIDLDAIAYNYKSIADFVYPARVMPVIKANAYGHGLTTCAKLYAELGAPILSVAFVEEAIQLRQAGVMTPILVLGGILNTQIAHFINFNIDITASSVSKLEAIDETAKALGKRARIHLKIDTGLERLGVHWYSAEALLQKAITCPNVDIVGIFSHFACVREGDLEFTKLQLERFLEVCSFFDRHSYPLPLRHIAATGGLLALRDSHLEMVRPGLGLYGVVPTPGLRGVIDLKPSMCLKTTVVYFKVVKAGAGVSYGHTWTAPRDCRVVTLPVGYGDGYFRRLSNKGQVLIRGKRYPIIGTICMDQTMVNIDWEEAYNGDEVVLIGSQGKESITVQEVAQLAETNCHEVMVALNMRVNRQYFRAGQAVS